MLAGALIALAVSDAEAAPCGATVLVGAGDNLAAIARRCDVGLTALLKANPAIRDPNLIPLGAELAIPVAAKANDASASGEGGTAPKGARSYVVTPGDTLGTIARRYRVGVSDLINANPRIDPNFLNVGVLLRLPGGATDDAGPTPAQTSLVQVEPATSAPGKQVKLTAKDLPSKSRVLIGAGRYGDSHLILHQARTDADGELEVSVRIPAWAAGTERFGFVVEVPESGLILRSGPVTVTSPASAKSHEAATEAGWRAR